MVGGTLGLIVLIRRQGKPAATDPAATDPNAGYLPSDGTGLAYNNDLPGGSASVPGGGWVFPTTTAPDPVDPLPVDLPTPTTATPVVATAAPPIGSPAATPAPPAAPPAPASPKVTPGWIHETDGSWTFRNDQGHLAHNVPAPKAGSRILADHYKPRGSSAPAPGNQPTGTAPPTGGGSSTAGTGTGGGTITHAPGPAPVDHSHWSGYYYSGGKIYFQNDQGNIAGPFTKAQVGNHPILASRPR